MQIWNGSHEYCWRYRADTILSTDGQTDRRTDGQGDTSIPPYQLRWSGGYKEDKVKVTNLKNSPKFKIFEFWNGHYTRHTFWSCLIRCANIKMDPMSIVEDTERTRFCPQTDRRTRWYQYTPLSTSLKRGYKYVSYILINIFFVVLCAESCYFGPWHIS